MFGISAPLSKEDLFVTWSKMSSKPQNALLLTAASALCWTIWLTRNEVVYDKCRAIFFAGTIQGNLLAVTMGEAAAA
jgi:hypothetical protein